MFTPVKVVYKQGVFKPLEPVANLSENQEVEIYIRPVDFDEGLDKEETQDAWEREWEALNVWEQQGLQPPYLTPEQLETRLKLLEANRAILPLPHEQALEIAMGDWLLEENLDL